MSIDPPAGSAAIVVSPPADIARLSRARWATVAVFLLLGALLGTWFSGVPRFQHRLSLDDNALGLVLLAPTIGSLVGMQLAGRLVGRFGCGPVVRVTAVTLPFTLPLVALSPEPAAAVTALILFGVIDGIQGVAMNVHGIAVERGFGRPVLSGMHAAWGVGALLGGAGGTIATALGLTLLEQFSIVAVVMAALGAAAGRYLLPREATGEPQPKARAARGWRASWTRSVAALGIMGAGVMLCEVGISNWGAIFLNDERSATVVLASLGYVAFSSAETGVRLIGDRLNRRLGPVNVVRGSGIVALLGLAVIVVPQSAPWNLAGFVVFGAGLAVINPIVFSAVGHGNGEDAGTAIARYTTLTYTGVLGGPALIGWLAHGIGLTAALACLAVPLIVVVLGSRLTAAAKPH